MADNNSIAKPAAAAEDKPALRNVGGFCANCIKAFVRDGTPSGEVIELRVDNAAAPVPCYYKSAPAGASNPPPTIFFVTDVFGVGFRNNQVLADEYAARGFNVYMPDYLAGKAVSGESTAPLMDTDEASSFFTKVSTICSVVPGFVSFLWSNGSRKSVQPRVEALARAIRAKARDLSGGKDAKLGAIGFCFGGPYALMLGKAGLADAWVACHPSALEVPGDLQGLGSAPGLFCLSEHDHMITKSVAEKMKQVAPAVEQVWYDGVSHGFAVRGPPSADKMREKCFADVMAFFGRTLA